MAIKKHRPGELVQTVFHFDYLQIRGQYMISNLLQEWVILPARDVLALHHLLTNINRFGAYFYLKKKKACSCFLIRSKTYCAG